MAKIEFKSKVRTAYNMDETVAWTYLKVPAITRSHCDMSAFRSHKRLGGLANSDMFPALIRRELANRKISDTIRMDQIPEGVSIDTSGFLAAVTIEIA